MPGRGGTRCQCTDLKRTSRVFRHTETYPSGEVPSLNAGWVGGTRRQLRDKRNRLTLTSSVSVSPDHVGANLGGRRSVVRVRRSGGRNGGARSETAGWRQRARRQAAGVKEDTSEVVPLAPTRRRPSHSGRPKTTRRPQHPGAIGDQGGLGHFHFRPHAPCRVSRDSHPEPAEIILHLEPRLAEG